MKAGQYIRRLAEFVTGEIDLAEFRQFVEERLFQLRQKPKMSDEKGVLAGIELYLHEAEEGLRDRGEVYAHVQSILDNIVRTRATSEAQNRYFQPTPITLKVPFSLSRTFDIEKEETLPKDLSVIDSK